MKLYAEHAVPLVIVVIMLAVLGCGTITGLAKASLTDFVMLLFLVPPMMLGTLGLKMFIQGMRDYGLKRLIENMQTSKVRALAMGFAEVCGKAEPFQKTFTAPLGGKKCVWYNYCIEEQRGSGDDARWVSIKSGGESAPFFLNDGTGAVLVNPDGARTDVTAKLSGMLSGKIWGLGKHGAALAKKKEAEQKKVIAFLKEQGIPYQQRILFGIASIMRPLRYSEKCIGAGDRLYVMGTAGDNPFVDNAKVVKGHTNVMIAKGLNPFYISDKEETAATTWMLVWSVLKMAGGVVGVCLGLFLMAILLASSFVYQLGGGG